MLLSSWLVGSHKLCALAVQVSGAIKFQYLCTYRGLRYAADGEVASASQNRLRHDPVMRYILRTRDEPAGLLHDYDARLMTQKVRTLDESVAVLVLRNADIPRPWRGRGKREGRTLALATETAENKKKLIAYQHPISL
jgi:hypothetical protein